MFDKLNLFLPMARNNSLLILRESRGMDNTIKHIISEFLQLEDSRINYHISHPLGEALQPDLQSNINIINFLREIELYILI